MSLPQACCRCQFKKSIIRSRTGSFTPQDLTKGHLSGTKANKQGRLRLCAGHAAAPQTLQKGKCTPATIRLLMTQALVRVAIKARAVSRNLNPSAAQKELAPFCITVHCTSLCLHLSFSCPLPPLPPFPHEHPLSLPLFSPTGTWAVAFLERAEGKGGRSRRHSHVAQVRVLGKGAWLDVS